MVFALFQIKLTKNEMIQIMKGIEIQSMEVESTNQNEAISIDDQAQLYRGRKVEIF